MEYDCPELYLRPESCKRFLAEYERWMLHASIGKDAAGFRPLLRATVEGFAAALRNNTVFRPWLYGQTDPDAAVASPHTTAPEDARPGDGTPQTGELPAPEIPKPETAPVNPRESA